MDIEHSSHFLRAYQKLPFTAQKKAEQKEGWFRSDPFDPRLKTHKLRGKLKDFYAFSIDQKNRIVFRFATHHTVVFLDVGGHDIYQ